MAYIISDVIFFSPNDGILYNTKEPNKTIKLTTMAAVVFNFLIERSGVLISREEILDSIWGQYGLQPSNNSLNQYIHIIRHSLQELGGNSDIIQTIPKHGFVIPKNIITSFDPDVPTLENKTDKKGKSKFIEKTPRNNTFIALRILIIIFTVLFLFQRNDGNNAITDRYFAFWANGCNFYTQDKTTDIKVYDARNLILDFMKSKARSFSCDKSSFVLFYIEPSFVTHHYGRIFIAKCTLNNGVHDVKFCESLYENKRR